MIEIKNITKFFEHKGKKKYIFQDASCTIPSEGNLFIFGKEGAGKSVLCKMLSSSVFPDKGNINIQEKISWPVGFRGALINNLTGRENIDFVCMIMGYNFKQRAEVHKFVQDFTEIGKDYEMPSKTYSNSMKHRINFAATFAFEFDSYILDDVSLSSDSVIAEKAEDFIKNNRQNSRLIFVTKSLKTMEKCKSAVLIKDKKLVFFNNTELAIEEYRKMFKNLLNNKGEDESEDDSSE
jgi:capsular polysaccharide transport system ATP-binding protein